jgi:hypothetical protein
MTKKNIIIVGYPKSGTTWLVRLVAELISCPVYGDWGFETTEALYKEGSDRDSVYQCFKSHHTYVELQKASELKIHKIIYIVRDPRDIVISGVHYFNFKRTLFSKMSKFSKATTLLNKTISNKEKKKQMILSVLNGSETVNTWHKNSWQKHYSTYLNKNILFVKYEDLIDSPEIEGKNILNYLKISVPETHIKKSIEKQSFQNKKLEIINSNDKQLKKLLRQGKYGYWKKEFSKKEILLFKNKLKNNQDFYQF